MDSKIDGDKNVNVTYNKIRAISYLYPGAFFCYNGRRIKVLRADPIDLVISNVNPGDLVESNEGHCYILHVNEGFLKLLFRRKYNVKIKNCRCFYYW